MTRPTSTLAVLLAGFAMLAFTGCRSTVVEPTRTVVQPVPVPAHHDFDHHDDHQPPPQPPPPDHRDDHR